MSISGKKHQWNKSMATKTLSLAIMILFVFSAFVKESASATANLLVNGDASNGLHGWKTVDNHWKTATNYGNIKAYDSYFFYPQGFKGKDGASTRIYQDVDIRGYGGKQAILSGYVCAWDAGHKDVSQLFIEFYDGNGRLVDKESVSSAGNPKWHKISLERTIPLTATRARVSLIAIYHLGSEVDGYFDNITLTVGTSQGQSSNKNPNTPSATSTPQQKTPSATSNPPVNTQPASSNLLVNGDASRGLYGWKTLDNYWRNVPQAPHTPLTVYNGNLFYPHEFKGVDGANTRIYQDVDIKNYVGKQLTLSAYVRTWDTRNTDESVLLLEFFDSNGKLLDKGSTSSSRRSDWHKIQLVRTVPNGSVRARVSLVAIYHYGSAVDSYFDNVELVAGGTVAPTSTPQQKIPPTTSNPPAKPSDTQQSNPPAKPVNPQNTTIDKNQNLLLLDNSSWHMEDTYYVTPPLQNIKNGNIQLFYPKDIKKRNTIKSDIYKEIDTRKYSGKKLTLSACTRAYAKNDISHIAIMFIDNNNQWINTPWKSSQQGDTRWQMLSVTRTVPHNAVRARVILQAIYTGTAEPSAVGAYFDRIKLTID